MSPTGCTSGFALDTGIASFAVRDAESLNKRLDEADVLVIWGLWHDGLLDRATKLRFIQSIGAGTDQFSALRTGQTRHPSRQRTGRQLPRGGRACDGS